MREKGATTMAQAGKIEIELSVRLDDESREALEALLNLGKTQGGRIPPSTGTGDQYWGVGGYGSQER